jgi:hypothetical protein
VCARGSLVYDASSLRWATGGRKNEVSGDFGALIISGLTTVRSRGRPTANGRLSVWFTPRCSSLCVAIVSQIYSYPLSIVQWHALFKYIQFSSPNEVTLQITANVFSILRNLAVNCSIVRMCTVMCTVVWSAGVKTVKEVSAKMLLPISVLFTLPSLFPTRLEKHYTALGFNLTPCCQRVCSVCTSVCLSAIFDEP